MQNKKRGHPVAPLKAAHAQYLYVWFTHDSAMYSATIFANKGIYLTRDTSKQVICTEKQSYLRSWRTSCAPEVEHKATQNPGSTIIICSIWRSDGTILKWPWAKKHLRKIVYLTHCLIVTNHATWYAKKQMSNIIVQRRYPTQRPVLRHAIYDYAVDRHRNLHTRRKMQLGH
jgi:hypothetical protein